MRPRNANGEGSVYRVGDRWRAVVTIAPGKEKTQTCKTEPEANRALRDLRRRRDRGEFDPPKRTTHQTVREYLTEWRTVHHKANVRESTRRNYRSRCNLLCNVTITGYGMIGELRLDALTPVLLSSARAVLIERGYNPSTVNSMFRTIKTALSHAVDLDLIDHSPADKLKRLRETPTPKPVLMQADMLALFKHAKGTEDYALYQVFLGLGLRLGEVLALRWDDLDGSTLHIRHTATVSEAHGQSLGPTKTEASTRSLTLPEPVLQALEGHRFILRRRAETQRTWHEHGYIFPGRNGGIKSPHTVRLHLKAALSELGLTHLTPHLLRHTFATYNRMIGTEQEVLKERMGHASIDMTSDVYTHPQPEQHQIAAERMGRFLRGESG